MRDAIRLLVRLSTRALPADRERVRSDGERCELCVAGLELCGLTLFVATSAARYVPGCGGNYGAKPMGGLSGRREGYPPEGARPRSGLDRVARSRSDAPNLSLGSSTALRSCDEDRPRAVNSTDWCPSSVRRWRAGRSARSPASSCATAIRNSKSGASHTSPTCGRRPNAMTVCREQKKAMKRRSAPKPPRFFVIDPGKVKRRSRFVRELLRRLGQPLQRCREYCLVIFRGSSARVC